MKVCRDRFERLLRYGRKNSGGWDDDCDCGNIECFVPDDGDVDYLIEGYEQLEDLKKEVEDLKKQLAGLKGRKLNVKSNNS